MSRVFCTMVLVLIYTDIKSQEEIVRMDYGVWADMENTTVSDLNFRFSQKIQKNLTIGSEYLKRNFDFFDRTEISPIEDINRFHQLQLFLDYEIEIGKAYTIEAAFKPTISSSWTSSLSQEDLFWFFSASILRKLSSKEQRNNWIKVGILNDVLFGSPRLIPLFEYSTDISDKLFLKLGFPESAISFQFNERNRLLLEHSFTGMYANVASPLQIQNFGELVDGKLALNGSQISLDYQYRLQPNLTTFSRIGYQLVEDFEIQDNNDNPFYDFGQGSSIFFSMGIMYNFK
ncbi:hypothetical protein ACOKFD_00785 [Flagellimonas sp. S174]|uniref:hypothetical protein n=1 Tax=Flagellimonas sp. S174 TaxID=3410790 RepID=UPI003BF5BDC7